MTKRILGTGSTDEQSREEDGTFGSSLDEVGYKSLGRRIVIGKRSFCCESELVATTVSFDALSTQLALKFSNGCKFTVPARSLQGLHEATPEEISSVELKGQVLVWSGLAAHHAIPALLLGQFGGSVSFGTDVEK
jgi:hypothetical protein